jgi:hypothetical protein
VHYKDSAGLNSATGSSESTASGNGSGQLDRESNVCRALSSIASLCSLSQVVGED